MIKYYVETLFGCIKQLILTPRDQQIEFLQLKIVNTFYKAEKIVILKFNANISVLKVI